MSNQIARTGMSTTLASSTKPPLEHEHLKQAVTAEDPIAQAQCKVGKYYDKGYVVGKSPKRAFNYYKDAASRRCSTAQRITSRCYFRGYGVKKDLYLAALYYRLSKFSKNLQVQHKNGTYIAQITKPSQREKDTSYQKMVKALLQKGGCYEEGDGVPKDPKLAFECYIRALWLGNVEALWPVGICYEKGIAVKKDTTVAVTCYAELALQRSVKASLNMSTYRGEDIIAKTLPQFMRTRCTLFWKAGVQMLLKAGECYEKGDGVLRDFRLAFKSYRLAAVQGSLEGQLHMGRCYENGIGVRKNQKLALRCYYRVTMQHRNRRV